MVLQRRISTLTEFSQKDVGNTKKHLISNLSFYTKQNSLIFPPLIIKIDPENHIFMVKCDKSRKCGVLLQNATNAVGKSHEIQ